MSRHGQPTLEHGETAATPREVLPPAEFDHAPGSYRWAVADDQIHVDADPVNGTVRVTAAGGIFLTEPQLRGLALCLQAAHARAWPQEGDRAA
jgi:hypothetical protein